MSETSLSAGPDPKRAERWACARCGYEVDRKSPRCGECGIAQLRTLSRLLDAFARDVHRERWLTALLLYLRSPGLVPRWRRAMDRVAGPSEQDPALPRLTVAAGLLAA